MFHHIKLNTYVSTWCKYLLLLFLLQQYINRESARTYSWINMICCYTCRPQFLKHHRLFHNLLSYWSTGRHCWMLFIINNRINETWSTHALYATCVSVLMKWLNGEQSLCNCNNHTFGELLLFYILSVMCSGHHLWNQCNCQIATSKSIQ